MKSEGEVLLQVGHDLSSLHKEGAAFESALSALEAAQPSARHHAALGLVSDFPGVRAIGYLLTLSREERQQVLIAALEEEEERAFAASVASRLRREALFAALRQILPYSFSHIAAPGRLRVVPLYGDADQGHWRELAAHLKVLVQKGTIDIEDPNDRLFGQDHDSIWSASLRSADIMILLVSAALFSGRKFDILEAIFLRDQGLHIVPILLYPFPIADTPIGELQRLPRDGSPILDGSWIPYNDRDALEAIAELRKARRMDAWVDVAHEIGTLADALRRQAVDGPKGRAGPFDTWGAGIRFSVLYAPQDAALFAELQQHLAPLLRAGLITIWHPGAIPLGADVRAETVAHLTEAQQIVLLVSADFIASDELVAMTDLAVQRAQRGEARIRIVVLRPASLANTPLAPFQTLLHRPVTTYHRREEAWVEIVERLRQ